MYCGQCGHPVGDNKFCTRCGAPVPGAQIKQPKPMKQPKAAGRKPVLAITAIVVAAALVLGLGSWLLASMGKGDTPGAPGGVLQTQPSLRPQLLNFGKGTPAAEITPSVTPYTVEPGLSNVINADQFWLSEEALQLLEDNAFAVTGAWGSEFFEVYESNRYAYVPNYVTVDSMMHTYHLYFSLLLNRTEKNYLAAQLQELSRAMVGSSVEQYDALRGTDWEEAAGKNVTFFTVAALLQNVEVEAPQELMTLARQEVDLIRGANGITTSPLTGEMMDYSQFLPRGYYEGDQVLEEYFRAMMWYGQVNFIQSEEVLNRCALLMTAAMEPHLANWEEIYTITSFFAGTSDDLGYYEYAPAINQAYGTMPTAQQLAEDKKAFRTFVDLIEDMAPPAINSVPVWQFEEGDLGQMNKGFRFMGQRFSVDAAVMQKLIYRSVEENAAGERRMLPDALDVPAAMGSDMALELLQQQGATDYKNYTEHMEQLRQTLATAPESSWNTSLYSSWLYTLDPVLEAKGEGWPSYMIGDQWQKRALECFLGSYTELKHDTVLYSKQAMAEMGGGPPEVYDDRGYVEPEAEVYRRFMLLAQQTAEGLDGYGLINANDKEHLARLAELAEQLMVISQKELQEQTLTDEEYELIRTYGGTLEHFWEEAVRDKNDKNYFDPGDFPASLVTDVATNPEGTVLQVATGQPAKILVVVPVDGTLRLACGMVYNFYQFEQPISQRLTDTHWHQMTGEWYDPEGNIYSWEDMPDKPAWTQSYWASKR